MILFQGIGAFFALEGAANIVYWFYRGNGVKDNNYWQLGRALRLALGLVLVALA